MLAVKFSDGTTKQCKAVIAHSYIIDQTSREGFDILFDASENLNKLRQLNEKEGAMDYVVIVNDNVNIDGEITTAEQAFIGYTRPMGVGLDWFNYHDQETGLMASGMCAYLSAAQPSELEALRPQIAIAVASVSDETAILCPDLFEEWSGAGVNYKKDDRVKEHHVLYKVLKDHTSQPDWPPCQAASLFTRISDPSEEYPLIDNPIRAENPWMNGQKCRTADGRKWISKIDNNVWQPGDYPAGWEEQL